MVQGPMLTADFISLHHDRKRFIGKTVKVLGLVFENNIRSCKITLVDPQCKIDISICISTKKILCSNVEKNGYYVFGGLLTEGKEDDDQKLILDAYMVRPVKIKELEVYKSARLVSSRVYENFLSRNEEDNLAGLRKVLRYSFKQLPGSKDPEENPYDTFHEGSLHFDDWSFTMKD